jgi:hypothetical protein
MPSVSPKRASSSPRCDLPVQAVPHLAVTRSGVCRHELHCGESYFPKLSLNICLIRLQTRPPPAHRIVRRATPNREMRE